MPPSWRVSLLVAALGAGVGVTGPTQAPNYRVTYHLRLVERASGETRLLASAAVSGPPETDLRLGVRARSSELEGLLGTLAEPDTVNLAGLFFSRRQVGRSRRGLPLWEEDSYRRWSRIPWGGTALLYPFGPPGAGQPHVVWVEITVGRAFAGDTASSRQVIDLVPETPGRRVSFRLGREKLDFDVALERPEPPRSGRDSALAAAVDVVCLRVVAPESSETARVRCGRLDDIARRVALVGGDTLMATFGWPPAR